MDMIVLNTEKRLCTCCMEEHEVKTVQMKVQMTFKNRKVENRTLLYRVKPARVCRAFPSEEQPKSLCQEKHLKENQSRA